MLGVSFEVSLALTAMPEFMSLALAGRFSVAPEVLGQSLAHTLSIMALISSAVNPGAVLKFWFSAEGWPGVFLVGKLGPDNLSSAGSFGAAPEIGASV